VRGEMELSVDGGVNVRRRREGCSDYENGLRGLPWKKDHIASVTC